MNDQATTADEPDGPTLRARRLALGLSQADIAGLAGVSDVTVGNVEAGSNKPRKRTMEKIMFALRLAETMESDEDTVGDPWQCPDCKVWLAPWVTVHRCENEGAT